MTAPDAELPSQHADPIDVTHISVNVPFVLRTVGGIAAVGVGMNVVGVVVVALLVVASNATVPGDTRSTLTITAIALSGAMVALGVTLATLVQRRTLRWLLRGDTPGPDDGRRALRMPLDVALITGGLWTLGAVVMTSVAAGLGVGVRASIGLGGGLLVAGFVSAGFVFVVLARSNRQVARIVLAAMPPVMAPVFGVRSRLLVNWMLTSGLPLVGVALVLAAPPGQRNTVGVALIVVAIALVIGGISTVLTARAIGYPLRDVVAAMRSVAGGRLEVQLELEDSGEVGLVQNGFNDMVAGLRERDRVTDLFGRHVGPAVAAEAISTGVTLSGESRDVVALFVDITGSTKLTRLTEPADFVAMLNRFFEVVVDEVESNGGLLNKFEGDAALCVFGAPSPLPDAATAALRTARAIRDRVAEMGELEVGVGVASGPVIAGQIGTSSRLEYTIIGDAVNEAARLTELAKRVDGRILASGQTVAEADTDERACWVRGRSLRLRGRETSTTSYRTVETPELNSPSLPRRLTDVARAVAELPSLPSHLPGHLPSHLPTPRSAGQSVRRRIADVGESEPELGEQVPQERQ